MNYLISLENIKRIINPFESLWIENINCTLNKEILNEYIERGNVFELEEDPLIEKLLKQTAYKILNYDDNEYVGLDLDNIDSKNKQIINVAHLAAAIYLNNELTNTIKITSDNHEAMIEKVLQPLKKLNLPISNKRFNWEVENNTNKWEDNDYIIEQLNLPNNKYYEVQKKYDLSLWKDKIFVNLAAERLSAVKLGKLFKLLAYDTLVNPEILLLAKTNFKIFIELWNCLNDNSWGEEGKTISENTQNNKKKIQKEIGNLLNTKEYLEKIITKISGVQFVLMAPYITEESKLIPEMIEYIYDLKNVDKNNELKLNFFKYFPEQYFKDVSNVTTFFKNIVTHDLDKEDILVKNKKIYMNWIENKETVLNILSIDEKVARYLIPCLSIKMINEKDILKSIITKNNPSTYFLANEEMQKDSEILSLFCKYGKINYINTDNVLKTIEQYGSKDDIETFFKNNPALIFEPIPDSWKDNFKNVRHSLLILNHWEDISRNLRNAIKLDKEMAKEVMKIKPEFYINLPQAIRNDEDTVYAMFQGIMNNMPNAIKDIDIQFAINKVPKMYWCKKEFLETLLTEKNENINYEYIKLIMNQVPTQFFDDKQFVVNILKNIMPVYETPLLEMLPLKIKYFFDFYDVKENYGIFLEKMGLKQDLNSNLAIKDVEKIVKKKKI